MPAQLGDRVVTDFGAGWFLRMAILAVGGFFGCRQGQNGAT